MSPKEEKPLFVVSDRRKFTQEGELRDESEAAPEPAEPAPTATPAPAAAVTPPSAPVAAAEPSLQPPVPLPPSAEDQAKQQGHYGKASEQIDSMLKEHGAELPANLTPSFEGLVMSLYMQAAIELGMVREENTPPHPDPIRARHTIDLLAILQEKVRGNLNERESHLLQNCLFELRMAFLEVMRVLTTAPGMGGPGPSKG